MLFAASSVYLQGVASDWIGTHWFLSCAALKAGSVLKAKVSLTPQLPVWADSPKGFSLLVFRST